MLFQKRITSIQKTTMTKLSKFEKVLDQDIVVQKQLNRSIFRKGLCD